MNPSICCISLWAMRVFSKQIHLHLSLFVSWVHSISGLMLKWTTCDGCYINAAEVPIEKGPIEDFISLWLYGYILLKTSEDAYIIYKNDVTDTNLQLRVVILQFFVRLNQKGFGKRFSGCGKKAAEDCRRNFRQSILWKRKMIQLWEFKRSWNDVSPLNHEGYFLWSCDRRSRRISKYNNLSCSLQFTPTDERNMLFCWSDEMFPRFFTNWVFGEPFVATERPLQLLIKKLLQKLLIKKLVIFSWMKVEKITTMKNNNFLALDEYLRARRRAHFLSFVSSKSTHLQLSSEQKII